MKTIEHFVGGKSFSGDSKRTGKVFNPATGEQSAEVKLASTKDVNQAVENAKKAFEVYHKHIRLPPNLLLMNLLHLHKLYHVQQL